MRSVFLSFCPPENSLMRSTISIFRISARTFDDSLCRIIPLIINHYTHSGLLAVTLHSLTAGSSSLVTAATHLDQRRLDVQSTMSLYMDCRFRKGFCSNYPNFFGDNSHHVQILSSCRLHVMPGRRLQLWTYWGKQPIQ